MAAAGSLFAAMGSGVVEQSRTGELGGFLGSQLGSGDPTAAYLAYGNTVVGIVVSAYAVLTLLAGARDETAGLTDLVLVAGVPRWAPLAARVVFTVGGCAMILLATGGLSALITPTVLGGHDIALRSFTYAVGQWPATVAAAGCAALLIGLNAELAGLAWVPVVASSLLALLGDLLRVPAAVQRLGFYRHVPDLGGSGPAPLPLLTLVVIGVVLALLGLIGTTRRDIVAT